ncbi:glycosyltransferase family 4 protein [Methanoculleus sp. FWC-SCC1]|uniref:Glycosyltransferase family 4 protein n=1 Tax=Methanoculleus frigidifontis TaxID=2584085 RepID=A0ABT8M7N5_9EURY|nr:glycosyltransferase family 4 protein [Methanoculleus sp. FWC-SCC1]MDN7023951.1 glycosyltransferase family 4 protein [Methanoculleus sp. FWC-SCC1]
MKVCMVSTTHRPTDGRIFQKEARSLAKAHTVTVIAPGATAETTTEEQVRIVTVQQPGSFALHPITLLRVFRECWRQDADVYHCHEPDALLIGMALRVLRGKRVIYDVHEHWPTEIPFDLHVAQGSRLQRVLTAIVDPLELFLARRADGTIAVSDSVAERFRDAGLDPVIIANYSIADLEIPCTPRREGKRILYMAGNMQAFHGIRECILAVSQVFSRHPDASLTLVGNVRDDVGAIVPDEHTRERIHTTGFLPYRRMYETLGAGEIGLLVFQPAYYNISIGLPNKLFDYMLVGLPVVASDFPEIRNVVNDAGCGILVDPTDIGAIADAVTYLLENPDEARQMGENGRRAIEQRYNWGRMETSLLALYRNLNGEAPVSGRPAEPASEEGLQ